MALTKPGTVDTMAAGTSKEKMERRILTVDKETAITPYETREVLFYRTDNGDVKVEILLYRENL